MSLETNVMSAMKDAMKNKDQQALRGLRAIKAAILNAKTAKGFSGEMTDDQEIAILQKMVKQRRESVEIFEQQGRDDLAAPEREEIEVIERFLPEQMNDAEIEAEVKKIIEQTGAESMIDMGKVMGMANKAMAGRADGKKLAEIVKAQLG